MRARFSFILAILAIVIGVGSIVGGTLGASYTYTTAASENIVTPDDASIPNAPLASPQTMKAEADIILDHTLHNTDGLRYAEMPRQVEDPETGEMVSNGARGIWITSTTLRNALNLGLLAYGLSAFVIVTGLFQVVVGAALLVGRKS